MQTESSCCSDITMSTMLPFGLPLAANCCLEKAIWMQHDVKLQEETELSLEIGRLLREREAIYAVARSTPAQWLEKYFLVRFPANTTIQREGWTEEENATIQAWKWWGAEDMQAQPVSLFKPEWLPTLLEQVLTDTANP